MSDAWIQTSDPLDNIRALDRELRDATRKPPTPHALTPAQYRAARQLEAFVRTPRYLREFFTLDGDAWRYVGPWPLRWNRGRAARVRSAVVRHSPAPVEVRAWRPRERDTEGRRA